MSDAHEHIATLRVDPHHPVFAGHFPGRPIVPGVLLIDWALAALRDVYPDAVPSGPIELGAVKFLQPVRPGAELRIVCNRGARSTTLRIECEGQLVASASLSADGIR